MTNRPQHLNSFYHTIYISTLYEGWMKKGSNTPAAELVAEVEAVMKTAEGTFGPLAGDEHLKVGWLGRHEGQLREMKSGYELHVLLSQEPQGCQPSQGSSNDHTALSTPWQPREKMLVKYITDYNNFYLSVKCNDSL